jgi:hypothetical protein
VINLIEPIRLKHHLPALGAAVVTSRGIVASGVTGVRKANTDVDATIDDQWHLGSDTKAMTAVIIGTLVERGKLNWEMTLAEVFPDLTATFPMDFRRITIKQLLSRGITGQPQLARDVGDREILPGFPGTAPEGFTESRVDQTAIAAGNEILVLQPWLHPCWCCRRASRWTILGRPDARDRFQSSSDDKLRIRRSWHTGQN